MGVTETKAKAAIPAPGVTIMRSSLGRARGRGAAGSGIHHWVVERLTAIALVPLTLWFIYSVFHLLGRDQLTVIRWAHNPVNLVLIISLIAMTFHHMQLGLQVIMGDYIHDKRAHFAATLANKAVAALLGLLCVVSALRLAFMN